MRKLTLPSGKTIEVISFEDPAPPTAPELHICPACRSGLVYPTDWQEHDRASWEVSLRCPNCEWHHIDIYGEDAVQRFDETLDHGTDELVSDLRELTRANMEDDVDRFVAALAAGHVLPEDF